MLTRFSCKNFPQPISHKIFPQEFPARFPHKNFLQDFPKLDPDWLALHHPIPNAKFPPITAFLKLAFPLLYFPQEFPTRFSRNNFPQDFPATISGKILLQQFPTRFSRINFPKDFAATISHKIFPQEFSARFSHKIFLSWILIGCLPITLFQMLNFHQSLPFLNWLFSSPPFPARFCHKNFPQDFPARFCHKNFPQDFPERFSHNNFPTRFFPNNFPQDFPARLSRAGSCLFGSPSSYSKC